MEFPAIHGSTLNLGSSPRKTTRTRTGCLNCRRKKRKCDEGRPACGTCSRRSERCEWGLKVSFRPENAQGLGWTHPSMRRMAKKRPRSFEMLDVTSEVIRDYNSSSPTVDLDDNDEEAGHDEPAGSPIQRLDGRLRHDPESHTSTSTIRDFDAPSHSGHFGGAATALMLDGASPSSQRQTRDALADLLYLSQGGAAGQSQGGGVASSLHNPIGLVPMDMIGDYIDHIQAFSPDGSFEDGIFEPGSAYHQLHSTLRNHLIQEVKSTAPTRPTTPNFDADSSSPNVADAQEAADTLATVAVDAQTGAKSPPLTQEEECDLWRNWIDEIAPWLDKFDNDRHFQNVIPTMAQQHDFLRYSMLALSARQLELKNKTLPTDRSLALYQEAIHLLLPHLPTRSTAVIASCVVLCVLEMLSCSPKSWKRHLDGCASLMEAVGINGFVGSVDQALFWCFARMDMCGGLISSVKTLIPVSHWASKTGRLESDVALFKASTDFANYSNYAVYLVAQVLDLVALMPATSITVGGSSTACTDTKFRSRWLQLWKYISEWYIQRPATLHPIMTIPSSGACPFPTIIFSNPAAISGNQLYHTASLLMLQNQAAGVSLGPKPRGILWHARQICAISISNDHHGAWTNSVQPIWLAGRYMSHPAEHTAILELLEKIERESGWGTRWRAEDLVEFWGDLGE